MPGKEIALQYDMFTGELVDTRTAAQKQRDRRRELPQQQPMFDTQTEVRLARTRWKPLTTTTRGGKPLALGLLVEDPRTEEEVEEERMRAAEASTYPLFPAGGREGEEGKEQEPAPAARSPGQERDGTEEPEQPERVSPVYRQYTEIKGQFPQAIVFFRMGDFYETFNEDAETVARELDIVLTSRSVGPKRRVRMAGVPHQSAEDYVARLVGKGHHVAVCERVGEEPDGGVMPREVIKVVTSDTKPSPAPKAEPPKQEPMSEPPAKVKKQEAAGKRRAKPRPKPQPPRWRLGSASSYTTILMGGIPVMYPL